jgi:hypothetical protein
MFGGNYGREVYYVLWNGVCESYKIPNITTASLQLKSKQLRFNIVITLKTV